MPVATDARLKSLQCVGDAEADPLTERIVLDHGLRALGGLLDLLLSWDVEEDFPAAGRGVPEDVLELAAGFLDKQDVFEGALGEEKIDWNRIRRAQELFGRFQQSGLLVLGCASLPACYANTGVALVLMGSGRLSVQVRRRLMETIAFLTKVMSPGSLGPESSAPGALWVRKVRLMHAIMRRLTLAGATAFPDLKEDSPSAFLLALDWSEKAKTGRQPIDQLELGYVLLTFSWVLVRGFGALRIRMSRKEMDDHIYAWAVIGHGLGIKEELRPRTAKAAQKLFERIRGQFEAGTEEGRLLTAALLVFVMLRQVEAIKEFLPANRQPWQQWLITRIKPFGEAVLESLARTFVRDLAGRQTANRMWVARAPFIHWLIGAMLRALMTLIEMRRWSDWVPFARGTLRREKGLPSRIGKQLCAMPMRRPAR
jgi:hypothetical protein